LISAQTTPGFGGRSQRRSVIENDRLKLTIALLSSRLSVEFPRSPFEEELREKFALGAVVGLYETIEDPSEFAHGR
jgi:hypothetical protein